MKPRLVHVEQIRAGWVVRSGRAWHRLQAAAARVLDRQNLKPSGRNKP